MVNDSDRSQTDQISAQHLHHWATLQPDTVTTSKGNGRKKDEIYLLMMRVHISYSYMVSDHLVEGDILRGRAFAHGAMGRRIDP